MGRTFVPKRTGHKRTRYESRGKPLHTRKDNVEACPRVCRPSCCRRLLPFPLLFLAHPFFSLFYHPLRRHYSLPQLSLLSCFDPTESSRSFTPPFYEYICPSSAQRLPRVSLLDPPLPCEASPAMEKNTKRNYPADPPRPAPRFVAIHPSAYVLLV